MRFNITKPMARALLVTGATAVLPFLDLYPLYARIGVVFPDLKEEYSYLDWAAFGHVIKSENESKGEMG